MIRLGCFYTALQKFLEAQGGAQILYNFLLKGVFVRRLLVCFLIILLIVLSSPIIIPSRVSSQSSSRFTEHMLTSNSCVSDTVCYAAGSYFDTTTRRTQALVMAKNATNWSPLPPIEPNAPYSFAKLHDISCTAVNECVAVGGYFNPEKGAYQGLIALYSQGVWKIQSSQIRESISEFNTVSCVVSNFCMVGGYYRENSKNVYAVYTYEDGQWQYAPGLVNGVTDLVVVRDIDCVARHRCALGGTYGNPQISVSPAFVWYEDGVWDVNSQIYEGPIVQLKAADCAAEHCSVILEQGDISKVYRNKDQAWGQAADLGSLPEGGKKPFWEAISCPAPDRCVAVGRTALDFTGARGLLAHETESGWKDTVVYEFSEGTEFWFTDVSCMKVNSCLAVGFYMDRQLGRSMLVAEFNGTSWRAYNPLKESNKEPEPEIALDTFVAFGDSLTTGGSIQDCNPNRQASPWGCTGRPAATPYPDIVREALGFDSEGYKRVGIWGYTAQEAAQARQDGKNREGEWEPQLLAIEEANGLVVGALGVNDLQFSNVLLWARKYFQPGDQVTTTAKHLLAERKEDFDRLFHSLKVAQENGATVVLGLYYNPYDTPNTFCGDLENIGNRVVNALNTELVHRAKAEGFLVADFRPAFRNRGSGAPDALVFGTECKATSALMAWAPQWLRGSDGGRALGIKFDPHPNDKGTQAMAEAIIQEVLGNEN